MAMIVNYVTGSNAIVWQQADGAGSPEELMRSDNVKSPTSISPDGTRLVFREDFRATGHDVMMLSLDGARKVQPLIQTAFNELNAEISPDGRWLAFESDESGSYEVLVRPFPT
jgi:Tol biopolymer transport system component